MNTSFTTAQRMLAFDEDDDIPSTSGWLGSPPDVRRRDSIGDSKSRPAII